MSDKVTLSFAVSLTGDYRRDVEMTREEYEKLDALEGRDFDRALENLIEWRDVDDIEIDNCWDFVLVSGDTAGGE